MIPVLNGVCETVVYNQSLSVRPYWNTLAEDYPLHWQPAIELILPMENDYTVLIDGTPLLLQPKDLLIISPGVLHEIHAPSWGSRYILQFDPPLFQSIVGLEHLNTLFLPYKWFHAEESPELLQQMNQQMQFIYREFSSNDKYHDAAIYSALLQLLLFAARGKGEQPDYLFQGKNADSHKYALQFQNVCQYINEHCTEKLSLEELSHLSGFSGSHFARLFRQFAGMTYYEYLIHCRVNYARNLLVTQPSLNITEISLQSGFGSLTSFNRSFKATVNCSPSHYRNLVS